MILRQRGKLTVFFRNRPVIFIAAFSTVVFLIFAFWKWSSSNDTSRYETDCETLVEKDGKSWFAGKGGEFLNGETQSGDIAHSGKFSSRVGGEEIYGVGIEIPDVKGGQTVIASIWVHSTEGEGDFILDGNWGVYMLAKPGEGNRETGWEKVTISVNVPTYADTAIVKFYAYCKHGYAYFDDLSIMVFTPGQRTDIRANPEDSIPEINLIIAAEEMQVLKGKRQQALRRGNLFTEEDSWVEIQLETPEGTFPAKARLKGDWTDHLRGDKWSFRIEMKTGYAWNRMVVFSLMNPSTRSHLHEWVFHKICESEDVLQPRYDFLVLRVNGENRGVYAYEEHFVKQLPEFQKRREGPVVKFSESAFWDANYTSSSEQIELNPRLPLMDSPPILPFDESGIIADTALLQKFEEAQTLMYQFLHQQRPIAEVFDVDKLAKYVALIDIGQAHHGFIWHNQRWYYNPVSSLLEPIAYDAYTTAGPLKWINRPFIGYRRNVRYMNPEGKEYMYERFFLDEKFIEKYVEALFKYTSDEFLNATYSRLSQQMNKREELLRQETPSYSYNRQFLAKNIREIRYLLFPRKELSVRTFTAGRSGEGFLYQMTNLHNLPVKIIGAGDSKSQSPQFLFPDPVLIGASAGLTPTDYVEVTTPAVAEKIYFSIPGIDSVFSEPVYAWRAPGVLTAKQELFSNLKIETNDLYLVKDDRIIFRTGKLRTSNDVIFPKGYRVYFNAGTELDFRNGSKFISQSPVFMTGETDSPVRIISSDSSMNGFTVLNAQEQSRLLYAAFDHLGTLNHKGWTLTGAVTFYESNVAIDNCNFSNSQCEDALNIIRSSFGLSNSSITHARFDGLDIDFCEGNISNFLVNQTGNDCLDFSGSTVNVKSARLMNAGDKGLSAGEESTVTVVHLIVENANLGAVAKDLSTLVIRKIELRDVRQGFAAYVKKAEYGPATMTVEEYKAENVPVLSSIEKGSVLTLAGKKILGD